MTRKCAWFKCGIEFEPHHTHQDYCTPECRLAKQSWKARRGGPLVGLLLAGDAEGLMRKKREMQKEIADATTRNR